MDLTDTHTKSKKKAKAKTKKWVYIRLKVSCIAKEASDRMKRQPPEREEILANHISDNELISKRTQLKKKEKKNNVTEKQERNGINIFPKKT